MRSRGYKIERFDKVLLSESRTPRWYIVASVFGWIIEKGGKPLELPVAKGTTRPRTVISVAPKLRSSNRFNQLWTVWRSHPYLSSISTGGNPSRHPHAAVRYLIAFRPVSSASCLRTQPFVRSGILCPSFVTPDLLRYNIKISYYRYILEVFAIIK